MSYYGQIIEVIDYIEDHLEENLTLDVLSDKVNYSKFHLHHFFKAKTGHSLMDYIRLRKLSTSLHLLNNTDYSVNYISSQIGFAHPTNFIRTFKNHYNMTPSIYRKERPEVAITPKIQKASIGNFQNAVLFEYEVLFLPEFDLVGMKYPINYAENELYSSTNRYALKFIKAYRHKIPHVIDHDTYYGLTTNIGLTSSNYMPSFKVDKIIPLEDPLLRYEHIQSSTYVVFKYIGAHPAEEITFQTLFPVMEFIYEWIDSNHYQRYAPYLFEKVDSRKSKKDYCEAHIYFPIKEMQ